MIKQTKNSHRTYMPQKVTSGEKEASTVSANNLNITLAVASHDFISLFQQHGSTDFSKSFQRQQKCHCKHPRAMNLAM